MPSRSLNDLDVRFRVKVFEFLARLTEANIPVVIACTRRSDAEQAQAVATGHSKVTHSKHQDGLAIDVVPYEQYLEYGADKLQWNSADPIFKKIGDIGEAIGMRWGGRFKPLNDAGIGWDPGHFEEPSDVKVVDLPRPA